MAIFSPARAMAERAGTVRRTPEVIGPPRWRRSLNPQVEELALAAHAADPGEQQLEVLGVVHEIQPLAVHDEERCSLVPVEVAAIGIGDAREVVLADGALVLHA